MQARGTRTNPPNRFEKLVFEPDPEAGARDPRTEFLTDSSQTIISTHESPDISFRASVNPYRGCEHGCSYCYARPYHEFLGFSSGMDFEQKILVKPRAAELLRAELSSSGWIPQPLAMSGVTDCYQPVERRLRITRACLEVLAEFRNPVGIVTKNHLVTRDADLLADLAAFGAASAHISITTLDPALARILEPRASLPRYRLDAIARLSAAGVPVGVLVAPVIPGLNEHEIPAILAAARKAGASRASYTLLRLPLSVKSIFLSWVAEHRPDALGKIEARIRECRGGELTDSRFGSRMRGEGTAAEAIRALFKMAASKVGLPTTTIPLSVDAFRRPGGEQMQLL